MGEGEVSCVPLKGCADILGKPLSVDVKLSFITLGFPAGFKTLETVPVLKKYELQLTKNYCPVAVYSNENSCRFFPCKYSSINLYYTK